jgi:hypothetical protein
MAGRGARARPPAAFLGFARLRRALLTLATKPQRAVVMTLMSTGPWGGRGAGLRGERGFGVVEVGDASRRRINAMFGARPINWPGDEGGAGRKSRERGWTRAWRDADAARSGPKRREGSVAFILEHRHPASSYPDHARPAPRVPEARSGRPAPRVRVQGAGCRLTAGDGPYGPGRRARRRGARQQRGTAPGARGAAGARGCAGARVRRGDHGLLQRHRWGAGPLGWSSRGRSSGSSPGASPRRAGGAPTPHPPSPRRRRPLTPLPPGPCRECAARHSQSVACRATGYSQHLACWPDRATGAFEVRLRGRGQGGRGAHLARAVAARHAARPPFP